MSSPLNIPDSSPDQPVRKYPGAVPKISGNILFAIGAVLSVLLLVQAYRRWQNGRARKALGS